MGLVTHVCLPSISMFLLSAFGQERTFIKVRSARWVQLSVDVSVAASFSSLRPSSSWPSSYRPSCAWPSSCLLSSFYELPFLGHPPFMNSYGHGQPVFRLPPVSRPPATTCCSCPQHHSLISASARAGLAGITPTFVAVLPMPYCVLPTLSETRTRNLKQNDSS